MCIDCNVTVHADHPPPLLHVGSCFAVLLLSAKSTTVLFSAGRAGLTIPRPIPTQGGVQPLPFHPLSFPPVPFLPLPFPLELGPLNPASGSGERC